jgi:hypothetical protein
MGLFDFLTGGTSGNNANYQAGRPPGFVSATDADLNTKAQEQNQGAAAQQQAFVNALQSQNGVTNQANAFNQQQNLANQMAAQGGVNNQAAAFNQLQGVANGTGPNPAQNMLNQATGQNVANQAALMAGQRGAGANAGLMARQAAMQGSNAQQQAAWQAATMQANQQLGAIGQMGGIAGQQVAQQQNQQNLLGNAAAQQVGQQMAGQNQYDQMSLANLQAQQNAAAQQNNANVAMQSNINNVNSGMAQQTSKNESNLLGGLINAGGAATTGGAKYKGGEIEGYASGGAVQPGGFTSFRNPMIEAHEVHMANGGQIDFRRGGHVPGQASVSGDSLKNDTVPAVLSPKEIVLPRTVTMHPDAANKARDFVAAIMAKNSMRKK